VFHSIDANKSGELSSAEFSQWWLANGGDEDRLKTVAQAFDIISKRDGKPGCSLAEFKEVPASSRYYCPVSRPLQRMFGRAASTAALTLCDARTACAANCCVYPRGLGGKIR
jgi:hypothetical protein